MKTERPSMPLLLFSDFLQHRLETQNVELLRRIVDEFLRQPRALETVQSMAHMAYPMVTILPMDRSDVGARECGRQLLLRMYERAERHKDDTTIFRELHDVLKTKIELVNWNWLGQIFDEFCVGVDSTLVAFVKVQQQAISIVPVRPVPEESKSRSLPTSAARLCTEQVVEVRGERDVMCEEDDAMDDEEQPVDGAFDCHLISISKRTRHNRESLYAEFCAVEAHAPWTRLYIVSKTELSFLSRDHMQLEKAVTRFWRKHARAVWERNFWYRYPYHDSAAKELQHERSRRQANALQSFEVSVMIPIYNTFGAPFFADLDARGERVSWWWYRQPIVDIVRFCDRDGLATSVAYLLSQACERFPTTPTGCELHCEKHFNDGRSMWSPREKYRYITGEINALKRRRETR